MPSVVFGGDSDVSISTTQRLEVLLDNAISAANFLHSLLAFDQPKTYLLIGQNQNEIRATGGFIGIAVEAKVAGVSWLTWFTTTALQWTGSPLSIILHPPKRYFGICGWGSCYSGIPTGTHISRLRRPKSPSCFNWARGPELTG